MSKPTINMKPLKPHADFELAKLLKELDYKGPSEYFFFPLPSSDKPYEREEQFVVLNRNKDVGSRKAGFVLGEEYKTGILQLTLPAPLWWELKQWLWDEFKINILVEEHRRKKERHFVAFITEPEDASRIRHECDSPVEQEMEAIRQAVMYVSTTLKERNK
jgi:hypothetical protein